MYWIHESKPVKLKTSCSMIPTNLSWDRTLCLCLLISSSTFHLFQQKFWFSSFEQLRNVSSHQSRWTLHFKFFKRSSSKEVSQACGLDKKNCFVSRMASATAAATAVAVAVVDEVFFTVSHFRQDLTTIQNCKQSGPSYERILIVKLCYTHF